MDRSVHIGIDGTTLINGLSDNVDNSSEGLGTDGYENGGTDITDSLTSDETFSGIKSDSTDVVSSEMLGDLKNKSVRAILNLEGVENRRELSFELHIDDGTNNLGNFTLTDSGLGSSAESTYINKQYLIKICNIIFRTYVWRDFC